LYPKTPLHHYTREANAFRKMFSNPLKRETKTEDCELHNQTLNIKHPFPDSFTVAEIEMRDRYT